MSSSNFELSPLNFLVFQPTKIIFSVELRDAAIQGINRASSQFKDTEIAVQVKEWREMIGPELQKENEMPEFNIRGVINDIDNMLTDGQEMKFEDLTKGKEPWEHCRIFAGMLQMANDGKLR